MSRALISNHKARRKKFWVVFNPVLILSPNSSDSTEPGQHIGGPATVGWEHTTSKCLKVSIELLSRPSQYQFVMVHNWTSDRLIIQSHLFFAPYSIVRSFDTIVSIFAQQLREGESFSFMTESILLLAELVSWVVWK